VYVVLEGWIGDDTSYKRVTASVERRGMRTGDQHVVADLGVLHAGSLTSRLASVRQQ
jgi:hypothetical protein